MENLEGMREVFAKNSQEVNAVVKVKLPRISKEEILDLMQNASLKELGERAFAIKSSCILTISRLLLWIETLIIPISVG